MHGDLHFFQIGELTMGVHLMGSGDRHAVVLHGFPDSALGMFPLAEKLASAGYTVAVPYLRGYAPTGLAPDGRYDLSVLKGDIEGLIVALGFRDTLIVGHDWGAVIAYDCASQKNERIAKVICLSVPPPLDFLRGLMRTPRQLKLSRYMALFQVDGVAEHLVSRDDFAYLDGLWRRWSPGLTEVPDHVTVLKESLKEPGRLTATLSYYRSMTPLRCRSWRHILRRLSRQPAYPIQVAVGADDRCIHPETFSRSALSVSIIPNAGHFLVYEASEEILQLCRGA